MKQKSEHYKFLISRYDSYFESVNTKASVLLAFATFGIAAVATFYTSFQGDIEWNFLMKICGILLIFIWGASIFFSLFALFPYTKSYSESLIFFGNYKDLGLAEYLKLTQNQSEEEIGNDLAKQVFYLAQGLEKKFNHLKVATVISMSAYPFLFVLTISIILNFK